MVREKRRVDRELTFLMLKAASDAEEYVALRREAYLANDRLGRFARRGLRNCIFEFCESASRLSAAFRAANDLPWGELLQMRQDLGHDYPEVPAERAEEFARLSMIPAARRLRRARFPKSPDAPK
ncbi:MAG: hypothetical protein L3K01_00605 [Thermoplasmata archaeon]|nr:hypothetical protein [Thermoplasmata archaeon]